MVSILVGLVGMGSLRCETHRDRRGAPTAHNPAGDAGRGGGPVARLYLFPSMLAVLDKSSLSRRILTMVKPGIIEPVSGDQPRSLGQGGNVSGRRLKPGGAIGLSRFLLVKPDRTGDEH